MKVMVYQDPITRNVPEEEVELVSIIKTDRLTGMEYWKVKFNDGEISYRWINEEDREKL